MGLKEEMMPGCWGAAGEHWTCLQSPHSPQQSGHPPRLSLGLHFKLKQQQSNKNDN